MKVIFFFLLILSSLILGAQEKLTPVNSWEVTAKNFEVDNLGYVYTFDGQKIVKYTPVGEVFASYSNLNLGAINSIDVSNPLRILALHKNQNTLVILDNTLSPEQQSSLDLISLGLYNTSAFTYSMLNNGIWFYDKELFQLIKTNDLMEVIYESGNLLQLLNKDTLDVKKLIEDNDKLYLVCEKNILVFDLYGAYYNTIHIAYSPGMSIVNSTIFTFEKGYLKAYNAITFEEQTFNFVFDSNALKFLKKGKVYELKNGLMNVYTIE